MNQLLSYLNYEHTCLLRAKVMPTSVFESLVALLHLYKFKFTHVLSLRNAMFNSEIIPTLSILWVIPFDLEYGPTQLDESNAQRDL